MLSTLLFLVFLTFNFIFKAFGCTFKAFERTFTSFERTFTTFEHNFSPYKDIVSSPYRPFIWRFVARIYLVTKLKVCRILGKFSDTTISIRSVLNSWM